MTTSLRVTLAAAAIAVSGLALAPVFAQDGPPAGGPQMRRAGPGGPGFGGRGPGGPMGDLGLPLRALDLTEAQREQVRGVMESHQAAFKEIGDRMRTARQALDAAVTADTLDEAGVRAKAADVATIDADAAVLRARVHQEVFSLLTAEQQAKARELRAQMAERMKQRADQRPPRPPRQ